ncbi:MAG: succinate dehydrogenase cytochrome b subunit [Sphingobacteriaceae bacterium]|jgi:succinate dehydrogenase / fumarate reductase cytochrome b subunit
MFKSSLGKKLVMGITGLFLISFLMVHCFLNSLIFINDGGETFNLGAEFMAKNWLIRAMEIVLFGGLLWHIIQAAILTRENKKARPVAYAASNPSANSKWYSRSMGLLGTILLIFLIIHLRHFWVVSRFTDEITSGRETLFNEMKEVFSQLWVVILYCLAMVSLGYHLLHGFKSAFQTLGWNHVKYNAIIEKTGVIISIVLPVLFAAMPIAIYMGLIK